MHGGHDIVQGRVTAVFLGQVGPAEGRVVAHVGMVWIGLLQPGVAHIALKVPEVMVGIYDGLVVVHVSALSVLRPLIDQCGDHSCLCHPIDAGPAPAKDSAGGTHGSPCCPELPIPRRYDRFSGSASAASLTLAYLKPATSIDPPVRASQASDACRSASCRGSRMASGRTEVDAYGNLDPGG